MALPKKSLPLGIAAEPQLSLRPVTRDPLDDQLDEVLTQNAELERELLEAREKLQRAQLEAELDARAQAGDLEPPQTIDNLRDAQHWLAWARANSHQEGCLCNRCPPARRLVNRP